jgi:hypothetical protein
MRGHHHRRRISRAFPRAGGRVLDLTLTPRCSSGGWVVIDAWALFERRCHDPLLAVTFEEVPTGVPAPFAPPRGSWRARGLLVMAPVKRRCRRAVDPANAELVRWPERPTGRLKTGNCIPGTALRTGPVCGAGGSAMFPRERRIAVAGLRRSAGWGSAPRPSNHSDMAAR